MINIEQVLDHFSFGYTISHRDKQNIPASGRVLIVANHPLGAVDALALIQLIREIRPDVKVVANELLVHLRPLRNLLLAVDNLGGASHKEQIRVMSRQPYPLDQAALDECRSVIPGRDAEEEFKAMRDYLHAFGHSIPTLYKQYSDVCELGGAQFLAFNVDPDFSNRIDGLICVDLSLLKEAKTRRYIGNVEVAR